MSQATTAAISDAERAAMRARTDAATRGPWTWTSYAVPTLEGRAGDPDGYEYDTEVIEVEHSGGGCCSPCHLELRISDADREFIANARTDMERLLDENDRLRAARPTAGQISDALAHHQAVVFTADRFDQVPVGPSGYLSPGGQRAVPALTGWRIVTASAARPTDLSGSTHFTATSGDILLQAQVEAIMALLRPAASEVS